MLRCDFPISTALLLRTDNKLICQARDGPVQFEKDNADPFNIDEMISEATGGQAGRKRYGIEEPSDRESKRAKVGADET